MAEARRKADDAVLRRKLTTSRAAVKKKEGLATKAERFLKRVQNAEARLHEEGKRKKREHTDMFLDEADEAKAKVARATEELARSQTALKNEKEKLARLEEEAGK